MSKKGDYSIPFDKDGNQLHYPDWWSMDRDGPGDWRPNVAFDDTLTYSGYERGRSAAYFRFVRADGKGVTMFLTDFEEVVPKMVRGKVAGRWTFCKRGQNYGVQLVAGE
jgi:hypothetical protein